VEVVGTVAESFIFASLLPGLTKYVQEAGESSVCGLSIYLPNNFGEYNVPVRSTGPLVRSFVCYWPESKIRDLQFIKPLL